METRGMEDPRTLRKSAEGSDSYRIFSFTSKDYQR